MSYGHALLILGCAAALSIVLAAATVTILVRSGRALGRTVCRGVARGWRMLRDAAPGGVARGGVRLELDRYELPPASKEARKKPTCN